jgi:hypothetical protein
MLLEQDKQRGGDVVGGGKAEKVQAVVGEGEAESGGDVVGGG